MAYAQSGARAEHRAALRARELADMRWSDAELAVMERAERLRAYGAGGAASDVVSRDVVIPTNLDDAEIPMAVSLDIARWYYAYVGRTWDGSIETIISARRSSGRRRRRLANGSGTTTGRDNSEGRMYCASHLLVEPLDSHPRPLEVADYTMHVGWPEAVDVGRLEWDNPNGLACIFCEALLLPSETIPAEGAPGVLRGRHCCREGCACCELRRSGADKIAN